MSWSETAKQFAHEHPTWHQEHPNWNQEHPSLAVPDARDEEKRR